MTVRCSALWMSLMAIATPALAGAPPSLGPVVAASAGGPVTGGGFSVGFTVGETVVGLMLAPAAPLAHSAGFWGSGSGLVLGIEPTIDAPPAARLALAIAPNPFASTTEIRFIVPTGAAASATRIELFDASGRCVRRFALTEGDSGPRSVLWDGRDAAGRALPMGMYHCRVEAGSSLEYRRIALLR